MSLDTGLRKVAHALYVSLNTPRSLTAAILLREEEWDQLVDLAVDPRNYLEGTIGAERFRRDRQATDFLRKSPLINTGRDLRKAALDTFWACEKQCFNTNELIGLIRLQCGGEIPILSRARDILSRARKIAGRILGPLPDDLEGAFGPGTSFELKDTPFSTVADKLWITPHCTPDCMPVFEHTFWGTLWGRTRLRLGLPLPETVRGNRFSTVPKDATKHRGICVEPLGNLWVQLGVGRYLKRRLARVGLRVDKSASILDPIRLYEPRPPMDGQTLHQILAREGSLGGGWATLDLSNASDTVALELVREVLPPDWFWLLSLCRSPFTLVPTDRVTPTGRIYTWVKLDKFSSMGNGSTFELETLLFAVLLAAGCNLEIGRTLFVYGDDILLPDNKFSDASALLKLFGFTPNPKKCFNEGPFRESCGGDFFSGYNVRPYFADGRFESPVEWISMHNELLRRWGPSLATKRCVEQIPSRFRLFGPRNLGHRVLWGSWKGFWKNGIHWVRTLSDRPLIIPLDRWGCEFVYTLAVLGSRSVGLSPPREKVGLTIGKASVS